MDPKSRFDRQLPVQAAQLHGPKRIRCSRTTARKPGFERRFFKPEFGIYPARQKDLTQAGKTPTVASVPELPGRYAGHAVWTR